MAEHKLGGWSAAQDATAEIKKIIDEIRPIVEAKTMTRYAFFLAVQYKKQVVAGVKYAVKVNVGEGKYLQLNISENLSSNGGGIKLINVGEDSGKDKPITPF